MKSDLLMFCFVINDFNNDIYLLKTYLRKMHTFYFSHLFLFRFNVWIPS